MAGTHINDQLTDAFTPLKQVQQRARILAFISVLLKLVNGMPTFSSSAAALGDSLSGPAKSFGFRPTLLQPLAELFFVKTIEDGKVRAEPERMKQGGALKKL